MNEMQIFENNQFGQVRTIENDGQPWFVASDVCRALEIDSTATRRLDDDEKAVLRLTQTSSNGVEQGRDVIIVNEYGLYTLVLGSRKPEAKAFKRWITHEVIPAIRAHGGYLTPQKIEEVLSDPDTIIRLAQDLKEERTLRLRLQEKNSELVVQKQIMQPKADYFDELVERGVNLSFRETAKQLGIGERVFVNFLLEHKYVYRDRKGKLAPCAQHADDGLFVIKECYNEKTNWGGAQTLITPKGRETFRLLMQGLKTA